MAETFEQVRAALAAYNATMTGIQRSYEHSPEALHDFPCVLHLPAAGDFEYESFSGQCMTKIHQVRVIIVAGVRSDLPEDDETLVPFIDRVPDHLRNNPTLGLDSVATPARVVDYKLVNLVYARTVHLALEFTVEVAVYDDE